jgi:beta-glucosidase
VAPSPDSDAVTTGMRSDQSTASGAEVQSSVEAALSSLTLEEKTMLLGGQDEWSLPALPKIGLRSIVMSDGPIGVRGVRWTPDDPATALPCPSALAATWDRALARRVGRVLAQEARAKGVHAVLAPTINLHRSPLGGRHFECYSEDPLLTAQMAVSYVEGMQSGGVAAVPKHFVANEAETERFTVNNVVAERTLRELYLEPFHAVVDAGAWALMAAYNAVNGQTMTESARFQRGILRDEWGFDGVVVSDWLAARSTVRDMEGGMDLAMPGPGTVYGDRLAEAVRAGDVRGLLVDEAVRRVLVLAARVGCLEAVGPVRDRAVSSERARVVAREVAARGSVLLENRGGALPLNPSALSRLAVIGSAAARPRVQGGGAAQVFPTSVVSPLDAIGTSLRPQTKVVHAVGAAISDGFEIAQVGFDLRAVIRDATSAIVADVPLASGEVQWTGSDFPEPATHETTRSVELVGIYTPATTGFHQFATKAIGQMVLTVDDAVLFRGEEEAQGSGDPLEAFFSPSIVRGGAELEAGTPARVSLSYVVPAAPEGQNQAVVVTLMHRAPQQDAESLLAEAESLAAASDVAIVVVATTETVESEGADRHDLRLPGRQDELVRRVASVNPRTIVVVNAGAPVEMPWRQDVAAVLLTWFPGQEAGSALADVLFGVTEPGGRLPTTWPARLEDAPVTEVVPTGGDLAYGEGVFIGYRAWGRTGKKPAYWFGHGLGYTEWTYDSLTAEMGPDQQSLRVTVRVRNVGRRTGREVIQLYVSPTAADDQRPDRWLAGFVTVDASPGEVATATISVPSHAFEVWSHSGQWQPVPGEYLIEVGRNVHDILTSSRIEIYVP